MAFGGVTGAHVYPTSTWQWKGSGWSQVASAGPLGRTDAAMAPLGDKVVLFGGYNEASGATWLSDTEVWNGTTWTAVTTSPSPSARDNVGMAPLGQKLVLFGGQGPGGPNLDDTWTFDGAAWTNVTPASGGPSTRDNYAIATLGDKVVLFGGRNGTGYFGDTWTWDGTSWTEVSTTGPSARMCSAMAEVGGKLVLFGGLNDGSGADHTGTWLNDTWTWDGTSWTSVSTQGPSNRAYYGLATYQKTALFFGGEGTNVSYLGDTWHFDGASWTLDASTSGMGDLIAPSLSSFAFE